MPDELLYHLLLYRSQQDLLGLCQSQKEISLKKSVLLKERFLYGIENKKTNLKNDPHNHR